MRYELLLQPSTRGQEFDLAAVEQAIDERGGAREPHGARRWRQKGGEVEVGALLEAGKPVALEIRVPLSDRVELIGEALRSAADVARACSLRLVDPQLSRVVSERDEGAVSEQFLRTARYAGEMMGLPEAVAASFTPEPEHLRVGTKVLLGLVALGVLLYFLVDALGSRL